ncbi:MAG: hypothetical protein AMXMBFR84_03480 [Candidatus Hydrogenedentota bacterium]
MATPLTEAEYHTLTGPNRTARAMAYHLRETPRRLGQLLSARRYDVVFLQKAVMTAYVRGFAAVTRACAPRLIYDIDDAVHLAPPHPLRGFWQRLEDREQIARVLARAKVVLTGNRWLMEQMARTCGSAMLFPTVVDTDRFVPAPHAPEQFTVGWIGSASTTEHLQYATRRIGILRDTGIRLVGARRELVPWHRAEVIPWTAEDEVREIQRFSVGLMPLPKTDWARGKCALKALQYMACGVPCIATPFGAVLDIIEHGKNGLFADTPSEWLRAIDRLRDPAERQRIGEAGRATVEQRFALKGWAPQMHELLERVACPNR